MSLPQIRPVAGEDSAVLVVHGRDEIAAYDRAIDDLALRCGVPTTGRWAWMSAATGQAGSASFACLLSRGDELIGAAVFVHLLDDDGVRHVGLAAGGDGHRAYLPAVDADAQAAMAVAIADALAAVDGPVQLHLGPLPAGDPTLQSLMLALPSAEVTLTEEVVPAVRCAGASLDDYLSHGMLRTLRKSNNRLRTDGVVAEFTSTRDGDEIIARLPEIAAVSRDRDHAGGRASLLDEAAGLRRWTSRLIGLARLYELELSTLTLDGMPAAYVLGVEDAGVYRLLEGRFVMAWKRYSPGRLLEAHVLQRVLERPDLHELDWMTSVAPETLLAANSAATVVTADIVL